MSWKRIKRSWLILFYKLRIIKIHPDSILSCKNYQKSSLQFLLNTCAFNSTKNIKFNILKEAQAHQNQQLDEFIKIGFEYDHTT